MSKKKVEDIEYCCSDCGEYFIETFEGEEPHEFMPCPACETGEGQRTEP